MGREESRNLVLAGTITRPNRSAYDTFIIDAGKDLGVAKGQRVLTGGNILIGTIKDSYGHTSLVSLYSSYGNVFDAKIEPTTLTEKNKNIIIKVSGQGGGSFEATVPGALDIIIGDRIVVPSLGHILIGYVEKVLIDPRDPFVKILINSAVPLNSITEVQVEVK